jgi:uncharacterized protein (DUF2235 family)
MKRLVVCCDGTWGAERNPAVSNIVKIAEAVQTTRSVTGEGIDQRVFYVDGPGSRGYLADKLLGGAFGLGLDANLSTLYWQLALNWEPGDEIFLFGFSRGAYTARSLAGMIHRLGLLTAEAMIGRKYPDALRIYRQCKAHHGDPDPAEWVRFRDTCSHYPVPVTFVGVFDTVGAMGVPGVTSWRYRFHDLRLPPNVHCARQALAIDERRRAFAPCLWQVTDEAGVSSQRPDRVKQVWFPGTHGDVGGGNADSTLSDVTLRWMVAEAEQQGLEFDRDCLGQILGPLYRGPASPHDTLTTGYRIANLASMLTHLADPRFGRGSWRCLDAPDDRKVSLASIARPDDTYHPPNVLRWQHELGAAMPYEQVVADPTRPPRGTAEPVPV